MFKWQGGTPGGFRFPTSRLFFCIGKKKRFHNPNPFLFECLLPVNTAQINDSLSNVFVPPQLLTVLRAVAASISTRGSLSTYHSPHTLLLSPIQMAFITERNFANRCLLCLEIPSEIQGRDNLLCVLVVCVGLIVCMVSESYTLLTYFLTLIGFLLALRKIYPSHRKCNLIILISLLQGQMPLEERSTPSKAHTNQVSLQNSSNGKNSLLQKLLNIHQLL